MTIGQRSISAPNDRLDWRLLAPVFAIVAIDSMGMGVILPLLPFYAERFGATPLFIGMLFATFSLCQFGAGSDRLGRKPILMASQFGTCVSFINLALANSLPLIFLARILDGLTSGNLSVASALAVDHSSPVRANRRSASSAQA
ncbi:MFS transporter [Bradyrhizobium jicamae]|uniref:MFS transporter n=1 Tax=Bradyrhizobium jicamae TaxID=280332 RepID=UPI001BABE41A|nr:MFS transporter [Bradyrhizobium jicamae]MBR0755303.1 MFS transporter [Bradyrhizobium jicamae]